MTETELLVDCLRRLETAGIDYMLVGSMAGNYCQGSGYTIHLGSGYTGH